MLFTIYQSVEIENVLIQIHSHIHHMRNCVKSFDCDNKAYNFLALLTQLKGVKRSKEREWEREGDHIEGVHGIFTYATSKGNKRVGEGGSRKYNANNRKTRTRIQADNEICWLSASGVSLPKKKKYIYIYTHICSTMGCIMVYLYVVEYALRNAARWGLTAVQYCVAIDFRDFCQGVALLGLRIA